MKWYKMYTNSIRDIKFRKLQRKYPDSFSHYWTLWCMILDEASAGAGVISVGQEDWDLMFDLVSNQTSTDQLVDMLIELKTVELIDLNDQEIIVRNWEKYQSSQFSGDRVAKHRENKKNAAEITEIIQMFNQLTGKRDNTKTESNREHINARLEEGRTKEEMKAVILDRIKKWGRDPKMKQYIRPSTIFLPSKFDQYLNEIPAENIAAAAEGNLLKVRDKYGTITQITKDQFERAEEGYYTVID